MTTSPTTEPARADPQPQPKKKERKEPLVCAACRMAFAEPGRCFCPNCP